MQSIRLPRFKRSPDIASMRLTERDREILRHIYRHRFLRTDHLTKLLSGSPQQIRRRLQKLYHHGYLERPRCQIDY
ncbi:MAG: DeoR family transcriptional regulator, partial [Verrucomicrobia bacterium]